MSQAYFYFDMYHAPKPKEGFKVGDRVYVGKKWDSPGIVIEIIEPPNPQVFGTGKFRVARADRNSVHTLTSLALYDPMYQAFLEKVNKFEFERSRLLQLEQELMKKGKIPSHPGS